MFDLSQPFTGRVPLNSVARNPDQPRKTFDPDELAQLVRSIKRKGQQQPCTVIPFKDPRRPDIAWMLIDGERRHRACGEAGLLELLVTYVPGLVNNESELHGASFIANWNREGHTKAETVAALVRESKTKTQQEIADEIGKTHGWVWQMLQLAKLHPDLLRLMDPPTPLAERLPLKTALKLSQYPRDLQIQGWNFVKGHKPTHQEHAIRNLNPATGEAVRTAGKVKSPAKQLAKDRLYVRGRVRAISAAAELLLLVQPSVIKDVGAPVINECLESLAASRALIEQAQTRLRAALS